MKLQEYVNSIKTFKMHNKEWGYLPNKCQSIICCSDNPAPVHHGMIEWGGQYGPIIICEDCKWQIENKIYDKKITQWGLK